MAIEADVVERLIELVQKCMYLYEPRDPRYKDVGLHKSTWAEIAKKVGLKDGMFVLNFLKLNYSFCTRLDFISRIFVFGSNG